MWKTQISEKTRSITWEGKKGGDWAQLRFWFYLPLHFSFL